MTYFIKEIEKKLTKQEFAMAKLMISGYKNSEIATELNVSVSLVKVVLSNVFNKLNARNRANACHILGLGTIK